MGHDRERIIKSTIQTHSPTYGGESRSGAMQNASEKMCQNRRFQRPKQTPEKHKSRFWMFIWPKNWETPSTHTGSWTGGKLCLLVLSTLLPQGMGEGEVATTTLQQIGVLMEPHLQTPVV